MHWGEDSADAIALGVDQVTHQIGLSWLDSAAVNSGSCPIQDAQRPYMLDICKLVCPSNICDTFFHSLAVDRVSGRVPHSQVQHPGWASFLCWDCVCYLTGSGMSGRLVLQFLEIDSSLTVLTFASPNFVAIPVMLHACPSAGQSVAFPIAQEIFLHLGLAFPVCHLAWQWILRWPPWNKVGLQVANHSSVLRQRLANLTPNYCFRPRMVSTLRPTFRMG